MKKIKLAVLLSGGGRTLQNFIDLAEQGQLPATIELVVSTRAEAGGIARAEAAGITTTVVAKKGKTTDEFSDDISAALDTVTPDLVCLAGFMCFYHIPDRYAGRVMNIHPALLPAFGGKGMYGHYVHEAVLEAGCKFTGCTVHFADNKYDHGPIILQKVVAVLDDDDADTLADRVFEQEKAAYPQAMLAVVTLAWRTRPVGLLWRIRADIRAVFRARRPRPC